MASNKGIWKGLTVKQFQLLNDLQNIEGWEYMRSVVAIVEGSFDKVDEYPLVELRNRFEVIKKQLDTEPFKAFKQFIWLDGKRYYINRFFDEVNTAQYAEISEWTKDKESIIKNMHLIVASLLRETNLYIYPLKYNGKKHAERAKLVQEKMKATDAMGLSAFFLGSWLRLLEDLPTYLTEIVKKEMSELT
jgi:hypothetical protein